MGEGRHRPDGGPGRLFASARASLEAGGARTEFALELLDEVVADPHEPARVDAVDERRPAALLQPEEDRALAGMAAEDRLHARQLRRAAVRERGEVDDEVAARR